MKDYNKNNIPLAKALRKNMTPWERKLWYQYLSKYPVRFQRQKAIGEYIVDFYCAKAGLAIELDGGGHYCKEQMESDELRTQALKKMGVRVVRICNLDIDRNFTGVCDFVNLEIQKSLPQSASLTAPSSEGACLHRTANRCIFALGFFDGVHIGHQALLTACRHLAKEKGCSAGVVTFASHPDGLVLGNAPGLIHTIEERKRILSGFGICQIKVLPFDETVRNTPWQDFLEGLLADGAAGFVCGDDFRFGSKGEGSAQHLAAFCRERGLPYAVVPAQKLDHTVVSSTHIRQLLEAGEMAQAVRFLGHPYSISGLVIPGKGLGHTLGFPTANLTLPEGVICPRHGVYACRAVVDGAEYPAVVNIGTRPTVGGQGVTVEAWLLDFAGDLYNKHLCLLFYDFLRPEQKFPSLEDLQAEILKNAEKVRKFFEKY